MSNLENTPENIQELLTEVRAPREEVQQLRAENMALREENADLRTRIKDLEEKLNTNSRNSSRSSSQDPYRKRRNNRKPSEKKQGAQKGHKGHTRQMAPLEKITEFKDILPDECPHCGGKEFSEDSTDIEERQVTELPEVQPEITQFNIHTCTCADCGVAVKAKVPKEALGAFGPRLKGFISLVTGDLGMTKRKVVNLLGYLNITISVGSVCNIHHLVGSLLAAPYEHIRSHTLGQSAIHADETSWYRKGKRQWLWIVTGQESACFKVNPSRSAEAFQSIVGDLEHPPPLTTDRYSGYNCYEGAHQFCWSHIDRDFERIFERGDIDGVIGLRLKEEADQVFAYWRYFKKGLITLKELQTYMEISVIPPMKALLQLGSVGQDCSSKTKATCRNLLSKFDYLWTYLYHDDVEPTNNLAERDLRPSVIQRKLSYGTQSDAGEAFFERILTVVVTFKKQSKNIFNYLTACFRAHEQNNPIPSPL